MKLEGTLETFPLRELVDMVVYSSVTGALNIYGSGDRGRLYFHDGTLYHVEHGAAQGVEALAELLEHNSGRFTFVSDIKAESESLSGSLSHQMQIAERIAMRWRQVRPYVPHLELVPTLLLTREAALRRSSPAHQPVLAAIDGKANLRQMAAALSWAEIDLAEAIVNLSIDSLIDLRSAKADVATPTPTAPDHGGVFDRIKRSGRTTPRGDSDPQRSTEDRILKLLRG